MFECPQHWKCFLVAPNNWCAVPFDRTAGKLFAMSEHTTPTLPIAAATNTTQAGLKNEISESNRSSQLVAPAANLGHQAVTDALREQEAKVQGSNVAKWIELVYFVVLAMGAALFLGKLIFSF